MRVLVSGSRTWTDRLLIWNSLAQLRAEHGPLLIVHGHNPRGADHYADMWARRYAHAERHPVTSEDWEAFGKRAGFLRNRQMVELGAGIFMGYVMQCALPSCADRQPHGTHGVIQCAVLAQRAGIDLRLHGYIPPGWTANGG